MNLRKYIPEFIVLVYAILFLFTKNPSSEWDRVIVSDGKGYYAYLTAIFIYHDSDYGFIDKYESAYYPSSRQLYKDYRFDTGKGIVNKYFPGPAILWLPFFGAGHTLSIVLGYPTDGYSLPYQWAIAIAALFYFWLALLILRKILRFFTSDENSIAWAMLAVGLATNLIYYTVNAGCQVHVYNFFLINGFIYSALNACKTGKIKFYGLTSFLLGMIIISRPQNGLIVLALPFICGSGESFLLFLRKIFTEIRILVISGISLLIPLLVPLTYWHIKTGNWLVYSYGNESYNLAKPHLLDFLFSFEKGWMIYTPVAAFAAFGFISLFRKSKWQFFSLAAFLFFVVYFMSSWWIWTYTSYVSQRVMIDYYAFIAILLVFTFQWVAKSRKLILLKCVLAGFILLNIMQHLQQLIWVYPAGPLTAKEYFGNFFSFSKGTTFLIPENEVTGKQVYTTDFEENKPLFNYNGFSFTGFSHSGKKAVVLDTISSDKVIFARGMSDFKEVQPLVLKVGGYFNAESNDSSVNIEVSVGTTKSKYSVSQHNLMPGLICGKWKYAEMALYLPYFRSVNDSIFISFNNRSKGRVMLDDMQVELLKMQGPERHDWLLSAEDHIDTVELYHTDLETAIEKPWSNDVSISTGHTFSGNKSSCIQANSPYSLVFEKELGFRKNEDGYIRTGAYITGGNDAEVLLVFDFTNNGSTVFYKTYPLHLNDKASTWNLVEIFRELPVSGLNAEKVKIYYWYTKGSKPVYIDNLQVDIVKYKPARLTPLQNNDYSDGETLLSSCCSFEQACQPESGYITEVPDAYSGKRVCRVDANQMFSFSHLLPLAAMGSAKDALVYTTARVSSDQYISGATLVTDFRHNNKSVSYNPCFLKGQTIKGQWIPIDFGVKIPSGVTAQDSVLVYFYLPGTDEVLMIDDFCVSIRNGTKNTMNNKKQ